MSDGHINLPFVVLCQLGPRAIEECVQSWQEVDEMLRME